MGAKCPSRSGGDPSGHIGGLGCANPPCLPMTFADRAMGRTCWHANGRAPQATAQLGVHFVDAVQVGEFVEARCTVVRRSRALVFMRGELTVGERVVVAANGVWKMLRRA